MKLYSEADVRELLVFGMVHLGENPVRDYKEAGEFIESAERAIEERAARVHTTTHRLCGDRIVVKLLRELHDDEGEIEAQLRRDLAAASEGAGC